MALKYQHEIDKRKLKITCPDQAKKPNNQLACRFIFRPMPEKCVGILPINIRKERVLYKSPKYHIDLLPNIVIDKVLGNGFDYDNASHEDVCSRCNILLYDNLANAKKAWSGFPPRLKNKLGFTHILYGVINDTDGLMDTIDRFGHFGFYENYFSNLSVNLNSITPL